MKHVVTPHKATRKFWLCKEWLDTLTEEQIAKMLPGQRKPLMAHEIKYLADRSPAAKAIQDQRDARKAEKATARALLAEERDAYDAEVRERIREAWEAQRQKTTKEVKAACYRAGEMYLCSPVPRTLKQCMTIAAKEHEVTFGAVQAYLCGVGVRSLTAFKHGDMDYSEDLGDDGG